MAPKMPPGCPTWVFHQHHDDIALESLAAGIA
jgi:hypothetical protein